MGALLLHGLRPGPMLFAEHPEFVSIVYASLFLAIALTLVSGFFTIRIIVRVMRAPRRMLLVGIAVLCVVGSFAVRNHHHRRLRHAVLRRDGLSALSAAPAPRRRWPSG